MLHCVSRIVSATISNPVPLHTCRQLEMNTRECTIDRLDVRVHVVDSAGDFMGTLKAGVSAERQQEVHCGGCE